MPEFIDLFQEAVVPRKIDLKARLTVGRVKNLTDQKFRELFLKHYLPLESTSPLPARNFFAVDGSQGQREFANGYIFYVTRALGISNTPAKAHHLLTDIFTFSTGRRRTSSYVSVKSEYCEFQVIRKILGQIKSQPPTAASPAPPQNVILLDGSLYGRLMHVPIETNVVGDGEFSLAYLELYSEIFELAKETNTLLVGVSKDSNASFFRNEILDMILAEEMTRLQGSLGKNDLDFLQKLVESVDDLNPGVYKQYLQLKDRHPAELQMFDEILEEYFHLQTDHSLMLQYARASGYTRPMELGPARQRPIVIFNQLLRDPSNYLRKRFRSVLIEKHKEGKVSEFMARARGTIDKYLNMPTVVSFHLLPRVGDTPMRVDVPSYVVGSANTLKDFQRTDFLPDEDLAPVKEVLAFLLDQYVDLETYNIYLKTVDQEVKLSRETLDLYEQAMTKELGELIHRTRDYRRVKFL